MLDQYKMNKKIIFVFVAFLFLLIVVTNFISAEVNYCCERTKEGAWCQNDILENCNTNNGLRAVPTSCEATSYCSLGCCYDSQEGTCMKNTPEVVCNDNGGIYSRESASCDIPQCDLGCCVIGNQAAFVTQTRCKRLSALYGLETNFRTDITNEIMCIASTTSDVLGACVYERDYQLTCSMVTQRECENAIKANSANSNVKFHPGFLCSADELGTNCGPSEETICIEGKDEVYFLDTCGNTANIYDASKVKEKEYWRKIYQKDESCNARSNNAGSSTCGNCDYYLGSTCEAYDRTRDFGARPGVGDYICRDLGCNYEGQPYDHGETWCETNTNEGYVPGAESFRMVCYNGEVTIEPCAAFRSEVCIESEVNDFTSAACRVNRWQDCIGQDNEQDCENEDKRDCVWRNSGSIRTDINFEEDYDVKDLKEVFEEFEEGIHDDAYQYVCLPEIPPGFDFWNAEGESEEICSLATTECVARFEKNLIDTARGAKYHCVENCHCCANDDDHDGCYGEDYATNKETFCSSLGDCGIKVNYQGGVGYYNDEDALTCDGKAC